jgi:outer membrane protein assembly factor BamA
MNHSQHHRDERSGPTQRAHDLQQQQAMLEKQQRALQKFAGDFEIQLEWPAKVMKIDGTAAAIRTSNELIQHRLMEAGILYDVPTTTNDVVAAASQFIANLERSDCFYAVKVEVGTPTDVNSDDNSAGPPLRRINVHLNEKRWYKLHAGAGLKTDSWQLGGANMAGGGSTPTTDAFLPTAEVELRAGLRNIAGCLDRTDLQYSVDTHNIGTWSLTHVRPLYTVLPTFLSDPLLLQSTGSQYAFSARAALDTSDRIAVSSYHEYQRLVTLKASTAEHPTASPLLGIQQPRWYSSIEWGIVYRDLIPRRHATLPYHFAASSEIVSQSGASVKHGITGVASYSNISTDTSNLPIHGLQFQCTTEVATPPGDVGFIKGQASIAGHFSLHQRLSLHTFLSTGYLRALSFGGLCAPPIVSDRFLLGGTGSFRGFIPAGIGPRSRIAGAANSGLGDALGGNFFYSATAMVSAAPPEPIHAISQITRNVRLFGFATFGTCVSVDGYSSSIYSSDTMSDVAQSSRLSSGIGIATGALGPRVEATLSWPLRYSPLDGRRRFQFGVSFSIS